MEAGESFPSLGIHLILYHEEKYSDECVACIKMKRAALW